jgi:hypothetical protein
LANPDPPFSQPENHKLIEMVKNWTTELSVVLTPRSSEIAAAVIVEGDTDEDAAKALLFAVEDYFIGETKHESEEAFLARMKAAGIVHGKCSKLDNVSVFLESIAGCVNYRLYVPLAQHLYSLFTDVRVSGGLPWVEGFEIRSYDMRSSR